MKANLYPLLDLTILTYPQDKYVVELNNINN